MSCRLSGVADPQIPEGLCTSGLSFVKTLLVLCCRNPKQPPSGSGKNSHYIMWPRSDPGYESLRDTAGDGAGGRSRSRLTLKYLCLHIKPKTKTSKTKISGRGCSEEHLVSSAQRLVPFFCSSSKSFCGFFFFFFLAKQQNAGVLESRAGYRL